MLNKLKSKSDAICCFIFNAVFLGFSFYQISQIVEVGSLAWLIGGFVFLIGFVYLATRNYGNNEKPMFEYIPANKD